MPNFETTYMGLKLKSPIIVSSSGLNNKTERVIEFEKYGAGAVVLKSLFEEQIEADANHYLTHGADYPEASDYINHYVKNNSLEIYLNFITQLKKSVSIPVFASINCKSNTDWIKFARQIENAGADALELNIYLLPLDRKQNALFYEEVYYEIVKQVVSKIKIPVAVKMGNQFTNLLNVIQQISGLGARGAVLFNRFYQPDFDIEKMEIVSSEVLSNPSDIRNTLRWIGICSELIKNIDYSASTGVHDGKAVIKMLLAGASTVQVCSALYKNGPGYIEFMLREMETWMRNHGFKTIDQFRGRLNIKNIPDQQMYERSQFMRYYSNYE